jgi:hypothetical protein
MVSIGGPVHARQPSPIVSVRGGRPCSSESPKGETVGIRLPQSLGTSVDRYVRKGNFFVDGWLSSAAAATICTLSQRQRELNVVGGVAEIGIHHGKLFILLYLLSQAPEKAVAIDVFEDQHLNVDSSGRGDLRIFRSNIERYADSTRLVVHKGTSLAVTGSDVERMAEGKVRLFSVDGGHTEEITENDLAIADEALDEGGIIVVDDVFNEQFPGVANGVHRYFARKPNLVPFAVGANKTYFCRLPYAAEYRETAATAAVETRSQNFFGFPIAVLDFRRPTLQNRITQSDTWAGLRATPAGLALRRIWRTGDNMRRRLKRREIA